MAPHVALKSTIFLFLLVLYSVTTMGATDESTTSGEIHIGYCPHVSNETSGICIDECSENSNCSENELCCSNGCGHTCQTAMPCPNGQSKWNCLVEPCEANDCYNFPDAKCKANYCGGCFADFYLDANLVDCGEPVCMDVCHDHATCVWDKEVNSTSCECIAGYIGDGVENCTKVLCKPPLIPGPPPQFQLSEAPPPFVPPPALPFGESEAPPPIPPPPTIPFGDTSVPPPIPPPPSIPVGDSTVLPIIPPPPQLPSGISEGPPAIGPPPPPPTMNENGAPPPIGPPPPPPEMVKASGLPLIGPPPPPPTMDEDSKIPPLGSPPPPPEMDLDKGSDLPPLTPPPIPPQMDSKQEPLPPMGPPPPPPEMEKAADLPMLGPPPSLPSMDNKQVLAPLNPPPSPPEMIQVQGLPPLDPPPSLPNMDNSKALPPLEPPPALPEMDKATDLPMLDPPPPLPEMDETNNLPPLAPPPEIPTLGKSEPPSPIQPPPDLPNMGEIDFDLPILNPPPSLPFVESMPAPDIIPPPPPIIFKATKGMPTLLSPPPDAPPTEHPIDLPLLLTPPPMVPVCLLQPSTTPPPIIIITPPPALDEYFDCEDGYVLSFDMECVDINECESEELNTCLFPQACNNTDGDFYCYCVDGYKPLGSKCEDIDECELMANGEMEQLCDTNASCDNYNGSFTCVCNDMYSGNGSFCERLDPCAVNPPPCDLTVSECVDNDGVAFCDCFDGFSGPTCVNDDECATGLVPCPVNTECKDTIGSYECICKDGFKTVTDEESEQQCIDVNECTESTHTCGDNSECINTDGSYTCRCLCGFAEDDAEPQDGRNCVPNICEYNDDLCPEDKVCQLSLFGGHKCVCKPGFTESNGVCTNKCDVGTCRNQVCIDNDQAICECPSGFELKGLACVDIDECETGTHRCNGFSTCRNTHGGYRCQCNDGYIANDTYAKCCVPEPSCANTCVNGVCNEKGVCVCTAGWVGDNCNENVIECNVPNLNPCNGNGICQDTVGSYTCECLLGWGGTKCDIKVDKCTSESFNICDENADCSESEDGLTPVCTCRDGYRLPYHGPFDGTVCIVQTMYDIPSPTCLNTDEEMFNILSKYHILNDFMITIGTNKYNMIYASSDGIIAFQNGYNLNQQNFQEKNQTISEMKLRDNISIVAPFYKNTDIRNQESTVCMQLIVEGQGYDDLLSRFTMKVRDTMLSDTAAQKFIGRVAFIITWNRVPFIEQLDTFETVNDNTFQSVVVANEKQTYAITLYGIEGMKAKIDNAKLKNKPLIGYKSNDHSYMSPLYYEPNEIAERPDLVVNNITGEQGETVWRLDSMADDEETDADYCEAWYNKEPDFSEWEGNLVQPFCPQSGLIGILFGWLRPGYHTFDNIYNETVINTINEANSNNPFCLQTSFLGPNGEGLICCYMFIGGIHLPLEDSGPPIGGSAARNIPRSFSSNEQLELYLNNDVIAENRCCKTSNYWCDKYREKRPDSVGYHKWLNFKLASNFGDPYSYTFDGHWYSFPGVGEFIAMTTEDSETMIQIRQEQIRNIGGELIAGSALTAIVVKSNDLIFEAYTPNGDYVTNYNKLHIKINGESISDEEIQSLNMVQFVQVGMAVLRSHGDDTVQIVFPSSLSVNVTERSGILSVASVLPESFDGGAVSGLNGVYDGDSTNDFKKRDGETLALADIQFNKHLTPTSTRQTRENIYLEPGSILGEKVYLFGTSWRTSAAESIFSYPSGKSHGDFNDFDFVPKFLSDFLESATQEQLNKANETCYDSNRNAPNAPCLHDMLAIGDEAMAVATLKIVLQQNENAALITNRFPSFVTTTEKRHLKIAEEFELVLDAEDQDPDPLTYVYVGSLPEAAYTLNAGTGVFKYTPTNATLHSLKFAVMDGKGGSATIQIPHTICGCEGQGGDCLDSVLESDASKSAERTACQCKPGYTGEACNIDEDECEPNPCYDIPSDPPVARTCTDNVAPESGFTCSPCGDGYTELNHICFADTNPCASHNCAQDCTPTGTTFICSCGEGYTLDADGKTCNDVNECKGTNSCDDTRENCINSEGSYSCVCKTGFEGTQGACADTNECLASPCNTSRSDCVNQVGSYVCNCFTGYVLQEGKCVDIDECAVKSELCSTANNQYCVNNVGSYTCECMTGYTSVNGFCENINECEEGIHTCDTATSTCSDTDGDFTCLCGAGYEASEDKVCVDIDNCAEGVNPCSHTCTNTEGSYTCSCPSGYKLGTDFKTCEDINECEPSQCESTETCENTEGSFLCSCAEGFEDNGEGGCSPITECDEEQITNCGANSVCYLEFFDPTCVCNTGYELVGGSCVNVDECASSELNNCAANAVCTDSPGSYHCACANEFVDLAPATPGITCKQIFPPSSAYFDMVGFTMLSVRWLKPTLIEKMELKLTDEKDVLLRMVELQQAVVSYKFEDLETYKKYKVTLTTIVGTVRSASKTIQGQTQLLLLPPKNLKADDSKATTNSFHTTWDPPVEGMTPVGYSMTINIPGYQQLAVASIASGTTLGGSLPAGAPITVDVYSNYNDEVTELVKSDPASVLLYTKPFPPENVSPSYSAQYGFIKISFSQPTDTMQVDGYGVSSVPEKPDVTFTNLSATSGLFGPYEPGIEYVISFFAITGTVESDPVNFPITIPVTTTKGTTTVATTEATTAEEKTTKDDTTAQATTLESTTPVATTPVATTTAETTTVTTQGTTSSMDTTVSVENGSTAAPTTKPTTTPETTLNNTTPSITTAPTTESTPEPTVATTSPIVITRPPKETTTPATTEEPATCGIGYYADGSVCRECIWFKLHLRVDATFTSDLKHANSTKFKAAQGEIIALTTSELVSIGFRICTIVEAEFRNGSVIVNQQYAAFDKAKDNTLNGTNELDTEKFGKAISDGLKNRNVQALGGIVTESSVEPLNACKINQPTRCHANATCTEAEPPRTYYDCQCQAGWRDRNETNPGILCEQQCKYDGEAFCMNGGTCQPTNTVGEPVCSCTTFYHGNRCEQLNGGIVAGCVLGSLAFILLIVSSVMVFLYCRRKRQGTQSTILPRNLGGRPRHGGILA